MKRLLPRIAGILLAGYVWILRRTCRIRLHNDQRQSIVAAGHRWVYASFHAHQMAGIMSADRGTGAMVSRSVDGEMVVPMLRVCGHVPIRGSSGGARKGGAPALQALIKHVLGGRTAMLTVDGPQGPRGTVHKGIGLLAEKTDAAVVIALMIPSRRWILRQTWDQFQIPKPFSTIDVYLGDPLLLQPQESLDHFVSRIQLSMKAMEERYDAEEVAKRLRESTRPSQTRAAA
jgi:lysophospholipid acyltransferase (LPLAT)-like uncharacterized protein